MTNILYTGHVSLRYYEDETSRTTEFLTLQAFGDAPIDVYRQLFTNLKVLNTVHAAEANENGRRKWHYEIVYPSLLETENATLGASGPLEDGDQLVKAGTDALFFHIAHALNRVVNGSMSKRADAYSAENLEDLDQLFDSVIISYENDMAEAVRDGRWNVFLLRQKLQRSQNEELRRSRVETMRGQEIQTVLDSSKADIVTLRKTILEDEDTSFVFKLKKLFLTFM